MNSLLQELIYFRGDAKRHKKSDAAIPTVVYASSKAGKFSSDYLSAYYIIPPSTISVNEKICFLLIFGHGISYKLFIEFLSVLTGLFHHLGHFHHFRKISLCFCTKPFRKNCASRPNA
jgi:hypothetical protein